MSILRATAKNFIPGKIQHIIKKVKWHSKGITNVKTFIIEDDYTGFDSAFPKGRHLIGPPASSIKNDNPEQATPFTIANKRKPENKLVRQGSKRFNYCDN
jgi:hypothetical protein